MVGQQINCPLCCDKTFDSKDALLEHLNNVANNLFCPICNSKCTSLEGLTEHLTVYTCQSIQNESVQAIVLYEQNINVNGSENSSDKTSDIKTLSSELSTSDTQYITDEHYQNETGEVNKMYVELLSKQMSKPILQTPELKLIKEEGENRYMIVTEDGGDLTEGSAIVTKQNNDGTISLTTINDMKLDPDTLIVPEPDSEDKQTIYSCNTCKVSFSSVLDHIQNFHNDQEVVLEEGDEDLTLSDKQTARRVITDTGDIVEEPMIFKSNDTEIQQDTLDAIIKHPKLVLDKQGRAYTRRFVQIDKVPEAAKDVPPVTPDKTYYHKVTTKQVQMKTGVTVKVYTCMHCNITGTDLSEFESHPCKTLKYPCPRCPAGYENAKSLCAHMKVHKERPGLSDGSAEVTLPYECEICATVFKTNKSLKLHRRMHDPVKRRPIEAPVRNFGGKDVPGPIYRCTTCDKMIPLDYRAIHEGSHKSSNKMNCTICNKKFSSMEFLEMHVNIHNSDKVPVNKQDKKLPYKCLYCNRRFARPHEKVKHERIHTGEKPHSCEICGKSFRVLYCLTLHMRTHTGARPYECPHCGKRFKAHSVYSHHLLTHSDVRAYKCPFCPKAFKTSVQLAGHKNSHTKPFSCQHCNRPFASLYAVRVHTETHNRINNLKFSCEMCGASYARAFALKDHIKQVHKKDMDSADNLVENSTEEGDDWMTRETSAEPEGMQSLNKDLHETITEYEMSANELIIP